MKIFIVKEYNEKKKKKDNNFEYKSKEKISKE